MEVTTQRCTKGIEVHRGPAQPGRRQHSLEDTSSRMSTNLTLTRSTLSTAATTGHYLDPTTTEAACEIIRVQRQTT
eukprot:4379625-Amphidinium_carterae.1